MSSIKTEYINRITDNHNTIRAIIIIFYTVGIMGLLAPATNALFLQLIPLALVLSFVTLALFHANEINRKSVIGFTLIYVVSFLIEAIGVHTGVIFGPYTYGNSLGLKLFHTPLIIGVNWLFLVYTTASVMDTFRMPTPLKIIVASGAMLLYDVILEQMAPKLHMWYWENETIPLQNYIAWFTLALLFHTLLKRMKIKTRNKMALLILVCQFSFFLILFGANKLLA
ncbi:MAG: carotenoid biosynthesis protein [Marinilabiliaceae bacterium]|nr:carotenoid biosynthesis protein [Marinilabiliaceae bacterium]